MSAPTSRTPSKRGRAAAPVESTPPHARLADGEKVLYFFDDDDVGCEARVIKSCFSNLDGFDWRSGYWFELLDEPGKEYFCAAHRLTRADCKPAYLRLVHVAREGAKQ